MCRRAAGPHVPPCGRSGPGRARGPERSGLRFRRAPALPGACRQAAAEARSRSPDVAATPLAEPADGPGPGPRPHVPAFCGRSRARWARGPGGCGVRGEAGRGRVRGEPGARPPLQPLEVPACRARVPADLLGRDVSAVEGAKAHSAGGTAEGTVQVRPAVREYRGAVLFFHEGILLRVCRHTLCLLGHRTLGRDFHCCRHYFNAF